MAFPAAVGVPGGGRLLQGCPVVPQPPRVPAAHLNRDTDSFCRRPQALRVRAGEARSSSRTRWSEITHTHMSLRHSRHQALDNSWLRPSPSELVWRAAEHVQPMFAEIDRLVADNVRRVQAAFRAARIGPHHFAGSTGYGHGDLGRAALDQVMAEVMGAEAALVRMQFVSGTHAISSSLFALLRPGDEMVSVAGRPYDTLEEVIGLRGSAGHGSLREWGITYREVPLGPLGVDWGRLSSSITSETRVAHVQRSCGYDLRPTLSLADIETVVKVVRAQNPNCVIFVDNCYGEFTEAAEPCTVGADLVAGSLIKSPGGTLATGGGYVAGRRELVEACAARLTAPGVGVDAACVSGDTLRLIMQGLFLAPQMVGEALKGGRLIAEVMTREGYEVSPPPGMPSILPFITSVKLGSPERMSHFCHAVQRNSPVGSYVTPVPGRTAGYGDEVIFGNGTFVDGSTSELTADGPLREPYAVYCQGGTHWTHWAIVLEDVVESLRQT